MANEIFSSVCTKLRRNFIILIFYMFLEIVKLENPLRNSGKKYVNHFKLIYSRIPVNRCSKSNWNFI